MNSFNDALLRKLSIKINIVKGDDVTVLLSQFK